MQTDRRNVVYRIERVLRVALLELAMPAALAWTASRYLTLLDLGEGDSLLPRTARAMQEHPLLLGVVSFFAFTWLVRYWTSALRRGAPVISTSPVPGRPSSRAWRSAGVFALTAAAAGSALLLRQIVFEADRVVGTSMLPTLAPGDCVISSKSSYAVAVPGSGRSVETGRPRRGDLVVFQHASDGTVEHYVKRVIGLPGDRVRMRAGHPFVNDWQVPSCDAGTYFYPLPHGGVQGRLLVEFLGGRSYLTVYTPLSVPFADEYVVGEGELFVLGDNRNGSVDSRSFSDGHGAGVPLKSVDGVAVRLLLGTHRDGSFDASRSFSRFGTDLVLEGMNVEPLRVQIARCLRDAPRNTEPPPGARPVLASGR